jgi:hypothetical protein
VRALLEENKVRFARAEQLWGTCAVSILDLGRIGTSLLSFSQAYPVFWQESFVIYIFSGESGVLKRFTSWIQDLCLEVPTQTFWSRIATADATCMTCVFSVGLISKHHPTS